MPSSAFPSVLEVGVISDTHGLLRPQALAVLQGCDHLLHAGDIGKPDILDRLRELAPLTAVRGNNDHGSWAAALPETVTVSLGGVVIYLLHDLAQLPPGALAAAAAQVVVSGHSHRPGVVMKDGLCFLNPGSAGPRRFRLPVTLARLGIAAGRATPRVLELDLGAAATSAR
ncbi:metallophosphoesterase family protein [Eleftheria terrae]|uniref:metallophosphoesterase family protein n=1 Tax=Eleftheria terrae TaxID=1597781 RepID=UPI00263BB9D8|nr:metallophosphoesterase family protein [Eleftheria terrae]WKB51180.1 metallophosphatase family protein [Eleftheria terrae]